MSLVSVIVPTYNRRETIQAAIASVQRQTFADWELVVVDDGSTDDTAALIEGSDPRLVLIRQKNQGVNAARNTAMLRARGQYIAFLDSDDEWLPHHLELSVAFFRAFPGEDFLSGEFSEDGGSRGLVHFLHSALTEWYPPLAERGVGAGHRGPHSLSRCVPVPGARFRAHALRLPLRLAAHGGDAPRPGGGGALRCPLPYQRRLQLPR